MQFFLKYLKLQPTDYDLLVSQDPKIIQANIIQFTIYCKDIRRLAPSTIKGHLAAIRKFFDMNDIDLRWKRINAYQGEFYKVVEDRSYTHEEIKKLVDLASIRDKAVILLMASSGIRVGEVGSLRIRDLEQIDISDNDSIYK